MGVFNAIKSAFCHLFNFTEATNSDLTIIGQLERYDVSKIVNAYNAVESSLCEPYHSQIKHICDDVRRVYAAANDDEITIGVIGYFTVGKSTFVNAILGEKVVPESANPCTAVITKIKYGITPKAIVHYKDGSNEEMTYDDYIKFSSFTLEDFAERDSSQVISRFKNVVDATIFVDSDFLKENKICLVDTLGLFAHAEDNAKTIASINNAVAIIYVCSERGLSAMDVDFISKYLSVGNENIFFCVNRIDLVRKEERLGISQFVKVRLDTILEKSGFAKEFPITRIYQISSLFQNFANGFTDDERWRDGIDYQCLSGFAPMMKNLSEYVRNNNDKYRRRTINAQLNSACKQVKELQSLCEDEYKSRIFDIQKQIASNLIEIDGLRSEIEYINTVFDTLYQSLYALVYSFPGELLMDIEYGWKSGMRDEILSRFSFSFFEYMALKIDLSLMRINVFESMDDNHRYMQLEYLKPVVESICDYFIREFEVVANRINKNIEMTIENFATQYHYEDLFRMMGPYYNVKVGIEDETRPFIYRAVTESVANSVFMDENERKLLMAEAAKSACQQCIEKFLSQHMYDVSANIKSQINEVNRTAVKPKELCIDNIIKDNDNLEKEIDSLKERQNRSDVCFDCLAKAFVSSLSI